MSGDTDLTIKEKAVIGRNPDGTFAKGYIGGPGRPKGTGLKQRYDLSLVELFESRLDANNGNLTVSQAIMQDIRQKVIDKDPTMMSWLRSQLFSTNVLEKMDAVYERERKEDMDFIAYRLQKSSGDFQQQILRSKERLHVHMAGRRGAKTDTAVRWLGEPLATQEPARCLYMGLSLTKAMEQAWDNSIRIMEELGFTIADKSRTDGYWKLANGNMFQISGNTTIDERNKQRGFWWTRIAIDECQSQKALPYLHDEIFGPTLLDRQGSLMFLGTGPRVRGTYWEELWTDLRSDGSKIGRRALRLNWNVSDNPYIESRDTALEQVRQEHGWTETNAIYIREYLGRIAYDDDALVWRLGPENYYTDNELAKWIAEQPVTDVRLSAGLDYGFEDADGFAIVVYSTSRPERWLVCEYKARRTGTAQLAEAIRKGLEYVRSSPLFAKITEKHFYIYADTGGAAKKIGFDLSTQYSLPIQSAFKANKDLAVEILQDEVRRRLFKVRKGGPFDEEALKTVFLRNEQDELTRIIDDDTYHPDVADAVLYAMRPIWLFNRGGGE